MRTGLHALSCLLVLFGALALAACFGSGNSGPNPGILVSFSSTVPSSVNVGGSLTLSAVVTDDSSNSGVNWTATCGGTSCGSFNPAHTASGVSTSFTAPTMVPSGNTVTITAASAKNSTFTASANVIVSAGNVAITFATPPPPPTLSTVANFNAASLTAVVSNDALAQGVDWSVSCAAAGACGGFSSAHTASGVGTTFTAPPAVPAGGTVTVTAKSTTDPAVSISAVITLSATTPAAFLCSGCSYTYVVAGTNVVNGSPYAIAGVFTADGLGHITTGEQDFSDLSFSTGATPDALTGTYSFGPDGRGTITLNNGDANILNGTGVETLGVAFISASHMLITQLDTSATGSGTMDLQTLSSFSQSSLSGGYAFLFAGASFANNGDASVLPLGFGGVFNVDSPGGISGTGSITDANYGGFTSTLQNLTGSYPAVDNSGRLLLTLHPNFIGALGLKGPVIMAGYVNDAAHAKFVEVDNNFGVSSGLAVGQGASTGKLGASSVLAASSSYVFSVLGDSVFGPAALVTTFTSDGTSMLQNGSSDVNLDGVPSSGTVIGQYSVESSGVGRVGVTLSGNVGKLTGYAIYLTGGSDPDMVLELDANGITSGQLYPQASGGFTLASFQGFYGLNYTFVNAADTAEEDVSGQLFADGAGNIAGTLDVNANGAPAPGVAASGGYASSASGRFTGSITSVTTGTIQLSYFVVSPTQIVITETDGNGVALGLFQIQSPPF